MKVPEYPLRNAEKKSRFIALDGAAGYDLLLLTIVPLGAMTDMPRICGSPSSSCFSCRCRASEWAMSSHDIPAVSLSTC